jgi:AcrR family transcriptional regulator
MTISSRSEDRRIQRTRQLLQQASLEVLQEKGFKATSIQEIAERANVSRGTFYAHFVDKYALLESLLREELFQNLISPLPPVSQWDKKTLRRLIRLLLEHFRDVQRQCHPLGVIDPLIERFFQEALAGLLLMWLKQKSREEVRGTVPMETMAQTMSWAILGAALQWSLEPATISSEQMAEHVLLTFMEGVERLAPDALPE